MNLHHVLLLLAASTGALAVGQAPASSFDSGIEGWGVVEVPGPPYDTVVTNSTPFFSTVFGQPTGSIFSTDRNGNLFLFSAPGAFLGDQSAAIGGFLAYDLRFTPGNLAPGSLHPDVILQGAGQTIVIDAFADAATQTGYWESHSIPLTAGAGWQFDDLSGAAVSPVAFATIMTNLTAVWIRGDFWAGVETSFLDNPRLLAPGSGASAAVMALPTSCNGPAGPLNLTAGSLPQLGTAFGATATGFAAGALGFTILGFQSPGLPLSQFSSAALPNCDLLASTDSVLLALPSNGAASFSWTIPGAPVFAGLDLYLQFLQLELGPMNALTSLSSSNGLQLTLGS
ncbi:MAG: hypothetical protein NXI31_17805 [bacterium]|nr:hypothetical protein [bacterium]